MVFCWLCTKTFCKSLPAETFIRWQKCSQAWVQATYSNCCMIIRQTWSGYKFTTKYFLGKTNTIQPRQQYEEATPWWHATSLISKYKAFVLACLNGWNEIMNDMNDMYATTTRMKGVHECMNELNLPRLACFGMRIGSGVCEGAVGPRIQEFGSVCHLR